MLMVKSVIKTLMKTPINGARLSSSFGMRKHPILGFNKLAPRNRFCCTKTGTPIMASGNGVVADGTEDIKAMVIMFYSNITPLLKRLMLTYQNLGEVFEKE